METNIKVIGFSNKRLNGKSLDNKGFDLDYDGNYLDVNAFDNNRQYYTRLDNEDIMDLLNVPSSQIPLEKRIMQFNINKPSPMINQNQNHKMNMSNMPLLMHRYRDRDRDIFNEYNEYKRPMPIHNPNQIIMYYKPNSGYKKKRTKRIYRSITKPKVNYIMKNKTKRFSLTPISRQKTRKLTYARVSPLKPISRYSKHSRHKSKQSKPVSSIRQTIY